MLSLLVLTVVTQAEPGAREPLPLNAVSISIVGPMVGEYSIEYERRVTPAVSAFVAPALRWARGPYVSSTRGALLTGGARWFPLREDAIAGGLFVSPELHAGWSYLSWPSNLSPNAVALSTSRPSTGWDLGLGAQLGYRWLLHGRIALTASAGASASLQQSTILSWEPVWVLRPGALFDLSVGGAF